MTTLRIYTPDAGFREEQGVRNLEGILSDNKSVVWVEMDATDRHELKSIQDVLKLHPLSVEDAGEAEDRPRFRRYDGTTMVVFFAVRCGENQPENVDFVPLHLFMGPRFLVTVASQPMPELEEAYSRWKDNVAGLEANGEAPLYTVLDTMTDGYFPVTDTIADRVDEIEDDVIVGAGSEIRRSVFILKKALLRFRRIAAGGRDVVNALLRHDDTTPDTDSIYLRDVYDHLTRVTDAIDTYRDLLGNVMDAYLSVTSNRLAESANKLNVIMQTLTSWSIILGTGTFIAGIYGMNTKGLPGAETPYATMMVIGLCMLAAFGLFLVFRRKKWI